MIPGDSRGRQRARPPEVEARCTDTDPTGLRKREKQNFQKAQGTRWTLQSRMKLLFQGRLEGAGTEAVPQARRRPAGRVAARLAAYWHVAPLGGMAMGQLSLSRTLQEKSL